MLLSPRKRAILELFDAVAAERDGWIERNRYFYAEDLRYMRFLIPEGQRVLDLGCGTGRLLAALRPARGVGIDLSERMIEAARGAYPDLEFHVGDVEEPATYRDLAGPFDTIILSDTIGSLDDCESTLGALHPLCGPDTRIVIAYYSPLWEPLLRVAEILGMKMPQVDQNWLSTEDIMGLLGLADFDTIKCEWRILWPRHAAYVGPLINRSIGLLPVLRRLSLRNYIVARPLWNARLGRPSATVVIPCRNERGNVENAIRRMPALGDDLEVLFVEGGSEDGTLDEIRRVIDAYPERDIKVIEQDGVGKGNAVRNGFEAARGEVLVILDADLTVAPERLPKFYEALAAGKGNFINGSRLVYPVDKDAMRFLNMVANIAFAKLFSWLLNQRFTDTLCGTKALTRHHYDRIAADRGYFGEFDPFGDFDLIFGATKQNLKCIEIPVRYAARDYGETQISRFRHGWLLARMVWFAFRKLKAF